MAAGPAPRRNLLGTALTVVGVLFMSAAAWARLVRDRDQVDPRLVILVAAGVIVLICAGVWWRSRHSGERRRALSSARPGWSMHEVWADASLGASLVRHGVWERGMSPAGGTRLTLSWSPTGVELWRGSLRPHEVLSLPWSAIASVSHGIGQARSSPRPALVIETLSGVELVVVPAERPGGGLLPAGAKQVAGLVAELRTARDQV